MSYTNVYPTRINWENEPSIASPINATNLNKMDYALYQHDQTLDTWDVTKANQSDLLLSVKSIDYNTSTGVFVFTWQNGTTKTVDLNIEKIPVSFSMSPQGVITMTTEDGTQYTADVGSLIKTYTFDDSTEIDFTVTTDQSGNKTVTAAIKDGSIVGTKLEPNYLANCQSAANSASASKTAAEGSAEDAEAWAVGERDGVPVPSTDPAYNNNAKYWAEHTTSSFAGLTDTSITNPQNGQIPVYNSSTSKWENADQSAGGGSKVTVTTTESSLKGKNVTITQGQTTLTEVFDNSGVAVFDGVTLTGTVTITASNGVDTATRSLNIPYFGNYTVSITLFTATITATFPNGATCVCDGVTATTSPHTFTVGATGTYSVVCTLDGADKTSSVVITTDGQSESVSFEYGTINLTYADDFRGLSITCADGTTTITKTAPSSGNSMVFYPPRTGNWTISGSVGGQAYVSTPNPVVVSSLSTAVSADIQTFVVATVTLHGAAGAIISWTDEAGSQTQTLDTGGSKTDVTIKASPNFPVVVFEDTTVGKKPCDLSANFKKSVVIKPSLTDIYVMPDNSLYWYGYEDGVETCNSTNGWSGGSGYNYSTNPTYNTRDITLLASGTYNVCGIGASTSKTWTNAYCIAQKISGGNGNFRAQSTKTMGSISGITTDISNTSIAKYTIGGATGYLKSEANEGSHKVYALYYNTSTQYNFFSAADDVVTFKDSNNNDVVFAITDENGGAYVDYSAIPSGSYTLYSSVAKNPDSLSDAYSKQVSISSGTTSVYFMPNDNVLYWWGYENGIQEVSTANGWSGGTFVAPTHGSYYIDCASNNYLSGVGNENALNANKIVEIVEGIAISNNTYGGIQVHPAKNIGSELTFLPIVTNTVKKYEISTSTYSDFYVSSYASKYSNNRENKVYALWYE